MYKILSNLTIKSIAKEISKSTCTNFTLTPTKKRKKHSQRQKKRASDS